MAAACYDRKVGEALMQACAKHEYGSELQLARDSVLNVVAAAACAAAAAAAAAATGGPHQALVPALDSGSSPVAAAAAATQPHSPYKDYSQPLHVDCSVEYELPSQAKPPPGLGEPLLMIHPCYYRRAERERHTLFVNNLPSRSSTANPSSSSSSSSTSSSNAAAAAGTTTSSASSCSATSAASARRSSAANPVHRIAGLLVNPLMPLAAVAASTHQQHQQHQPQQHHQPLPSPSIATVEVRGAPGAVAAAAAATYHAALTALQAHQPEPRSKAHSKGLAAKAQPKAQTQPKPVKSELDDKLLAAAALYPHYFRPVQPAKQAQYTGQPGAYGLVGLAVQPAAAPLQALAHHPYRRSAQPRPGPKQLSASTAAVAAAASSSSSTSSSALPTGSVSAYMSTIYANAVHRQHQHQHQHQHHQQLYHQQQQQQQQQQQHHHHHQHQQQQQQQQQQQHQQQQQIHALHGAFYEAPPVYHALLPQS